jgi:hypothetical protein
MARKAQPAPRPERLGEVTAPSGVVMIGDTRLLWMWCHDCPPRLPEWRAPPDVVRSANESVDYRIEGPDAAAAARTWAGPQHPLYLYDRPPPDKLGPLQMTSWGDGLYPVYRDLDARGRLVRVRIDLGNEQIVARQRELEGR